MLIFKDIGVLHCVTFTVTAVLACVECKYCISHTTINALSKLLTVCNINVLPLAVDVAMIVTSNRGTRDTTFCSSFRANKPDATLGLIYFSRVWARDVRNSYVKWTHHTVNVRNERGYCKRVIAVFPTGHVKQRTAYALVFPYCRA